jgi:metal-dependent amidase/aminoacylase/carboxypeptidase family protein
MSAFTEIHIRITGDGGHGSAPEGLKVSIWRSVELYQEIQTFLNQLHSENKNFACTFPVFQAG